MLPFSWRQMITSTNPSICIPRLDCTVRRELLQEVFDNYNWGVIERIDIVHCLTTRRAFIHFKYWHRRREAEDIKKRLLAGASLNIIYKKPWFWKCSLSKATKPTSRF